MSNFKSFVSNVTESFYNVTIPTQTAGFVDAEFVREFAELLGVPVDDIAALTGSELYTDPFAPVGQEGRERTVKELYMTFLSQKLHGTKLAEEANLLSPQEIEARDIIFRIFTLAIEMLTALQACMRTQSALLKTYADWQKEYTDMIAQTPIYGPSANPAIMANTEDFGETKLGYANINVRQMAEYLLEKLQKNDSTYEAFNHVDSDMLFEPDAEINMPVYRFVMEKIIDPNDSTKATYEFRIVARNSTASYTGEFNFNDDIEKAEYEIPFKVLFKVEFDASATDTSQDANARLVSNLMALLTDEYNSATGDAFTVDVTYYDDDDNVLDTGTESITYENIKNSFWTGDSEYYAAEAHMLERMLSTYFWGPWLSPKPGAWPEAIENYEDSEEYDPDDEDDMKEIEGKRSASSSYRAELNAQLQLYIQNLDARKTQVRDTSKVTDNIVNSTREAIQAQSNLLTAITESLRSLLSAIFR